MKPYKIVLLVQLYHGSRERYSILQLYTVGIPSIVLVLFREG